MKNPDEMTLNEIWRECLRMWKWIAAHYVRGEDDVGDLKWQWLRKHGYEDVNLCSDCFFCHWAKSRRAEGLCNECPGRQVSRGFSCENYSSYSYSGQPRAFYRKLVQMDKKRRSMKE